MRDSLRFTARPLTPERWPDMETIFLARGCSVARGCWCMYYRISGRPPQPPPGVKAAEMRRLEMKGLVEAGRITGIIGYRGRTPVGWVSLGPREVYKKLARSPVMKPVDQQPVWSIVCFVVPREYRGQGVATELLRAAVRYAKGRGVEVLEAYPVDKPGRSDDETMWFGSWSMYDRLGFKVVARRRPARPVVRLRLR